MLYVVQALVQYHVTPHMLAKGETEDAKCTL